MRARDGWLDALELRRALFNLKSGETIGGLVRDCRHGVLVLVDAELYRGGEAPVSLDGEVVIDVTNVAFAQALAPKGRGSSKPGE